jgi:hypothetical protein
LIMNHNIPQGKFYTKVNVQALPSKQLTVFQPP